MGEVIHSAGPRLAELGDADLLALWAMRRWLTARRAEEAAEVALAGPFRLGGMPEGPRLVDDVMSRIAVSVRRPLAFGCVHCPVVSADENLLLGVLRLAQANRMSAARQVLHDAIACAAMDSVCDAVRPLVDCLEAAGLSLVRRGTLRQVGRHGPARLVGPHICRN